ncbi:hypothetical protein KSS87_004170 [Heliosperma pusillum]|nr:hypothetical protein KSS87_004170 [Heliosperma pusillum]
MAIISSITATMKMTKMISQDPSISSPKQIRQPPMPTKIILPDKKPMKWSTGVAPGEYGGPPTTTKLRKYWGGEKEDPITSSELIWNNDFMPRFQKLVQDMSPKDDTTSVVSPPALQGSTLSPFLFVIVMDELTRATQNNISWCMMFSDDIVLIDETKEGAEKNLELWRHSLETRGFRLSKSKSKTEYVGYKFSNKGSREAENITFYGKVVQDQISLGIQDQLYRKMVNYMEMWLT